MKHIFASIAVLTSFSQFLCIFCCVVPTATGIIALLSVLGLAGTNSMFLGDLAMMFHPYRATIMAVSVSLISLSWLSWLYARKSAKASCDCHQKAAKKPVFLMIATFILAANISAMPFLH